MANPFANMREHGSHKDKLAKELKDIVAELKKNPEIIQVVVSYSGSGDEGNIDGVKAYSFTTQDDWKDTGVEISDTLRDRIQSLAENALDAKNIDYSNGPGGQGQYIIDVRREIQSIRNLIPREEFDEENYDEDLDGNEVVIKKVKPKKKK